MRPRPTETFISNTLSPFYVAVPRTPGIMESDCTLLDPQIAPRTIFNRSAIISIWDCLAMSGGAINSASPVALTINPAS